MSNSAIRIGIVLGVSGLAIVGMMMLGDQPQNSSSPSAAGSGTAGSGNLSNPPIASQPTGLVQRWHQSAPLAIDVDGDGKPELLGLFDSKAGVQLGAFDRAGQPVWQSPTLETFRTKGGGLALVAVSAGRAFVLHKDTQVHSYALKTGQPNGIVDLKSVRALCKAPAGKQGIALQTNHRKTFTVDPVALKAEPLEEAFVCERPSSNAAFHHQLSVDVGGKVIWVMGDGAQVAALWIDPQRMPMISGYDKDTRSPRWSHTLDQDNPEQVHVIRTTTHTDMTEKHLAVSYLEGANQRPTVAVFDTSDGKHLWRVAVAEVGANVSALSISGDRLMVVSGGALLIFDSLTGALIKRLGIQRHR